MPRATKPREVADTETGQVLQVQLVPRGGALRGEWIKAMSNAVEAIGLENELTDGDVRVFVVLMGRAMWDNYVVINVAELARDMGRDRSSLHHALGRLVEHGYLIKGPKVGRSPSYRLSPHVAWKGNPAGHRKALREAEQRWGEAGVPEIASDPETLEEIPGQSTIEDALR